MDFKSLFKSGPLLDSLSVGPELAADLPGPGTSRLDHRGGGAKVQLKAAV